MIYIGEDPEEKKDMICLKRIIITLSIFLSVALGYAWRMIQVQ